MTYSKSPFSRAARFNLNARRSKASGLIAVVMGMSGVLTASAADIANWNKGTTPGNYNEPANWSPAVVPLNGGGKTYVVEIPANAAVNYDVTGASQVDAFRLAQAATFTLDGTREFAVQGISIINGPLTVTGAGAVFESDLATATLGGYATLSATGGGAVSVTAPGFELPADWRGHRQLLTADGAGSELAVGSLKSLTVHGGHGGGWDYTVTASNGGAIDVSDLTTATGPSDAYGNEDWLSFRQQTGGTIDLSSLFKVQRRTRFISDANWNMPSLEIVEMGYFQPGPAVTYTLPEFFRMEAGTLSVPDTAVINAPKLTAIRSSTIDVASGGQLNAGLVSDISGSAITLDPGETLQLGTVNVVDRMSFVALASPTFSFGATSYELPNDWRGHRKLLEADGAGVALNLSSLNTITVGGGHSGGWDYSIRANNGATIDLSGLTTATGARTDYGNEDWLSFYFQNGGDIDLSSLITATRKVRFLPDSGQSIDLPSLQEMDGGHFNILSGSTLNVPSLLRANNARIDVDFAGTVAAPALAQMYGTSLNVQPGGTFNAPAMADVSYSHLPLGSGGAVMLGSLAILDGASIVLTGPAPLAFSATSYALRADYRAHRQIFHASGAGATLDIASLQTISTPGGHSGGWDYSILAENGGVIDLSGLISATGPVNDYGNEDFLSFHLRSGGQIDLSALATTSQRVRFTSEEDWTLPSLENAERAYFYPGAGTAMNVPALLVMGEGRIEVPAGTVFNAPLATAIRSTSLVVSPGGRLNAPQVSDLTWSVIEINPGEELLLGDIGLFNGLSLVAYATPSFTFSATSYSLAIEDYRASRTFFHAEGGGVTLDLSSLQSVDIRGGHGGAWNYPFTAKNGAFIDLSGLRTVLGGRTDTYSADDWVSLRTELGGRMTLGDVTLSRLSRLQVADSSAATKAGMITLQAPARLEVTDFGTLELTKGLTFNHTDESQVSMHNAVVKFTGPGEKTLEVGGTDAGPTGFATGNFGIGKLEVGAPGQPAVVKLVDLIDNGNRGAGGEPEALYLYGVATEGLIVHPGSKLVIGAINVYVMQGASMVHLNALLGVNDTMTYGGGVVSRFGGPAIIAMDPDMPTLPVVDHVDVTFDTLINPATFTTADVQINGPAGAIPVSSVAQVSGAQYRVVFPGQSDHGYVNVRIGPNIQDSTGLLTQMDQNGNGIVGEAGDVFEGRFLVDIRGPAVAAAMVLRDGGLVGVRFDERVEETSLADPSNYAIGGVQPDPVMPNPSGYLLGVDTNITGYATLYFPPVTGDSFILDTVNLEDLLGNVVSTPQHFTGTVLPLSLVRVGAPTGVHEAFTVDGVNFGARTQGSTLGGGSDNVSFYCEPRESDFDVKLRVAATSGSGYYANMGLMVREHSGGNSRMLAISAYRPQHYNNFRFYRRLTQGAGMDDWGSAVGGVPVPNAWIRLMRSGNTFRASTSTDGENWTQRAETTFEFPDTLLAGFYSNAEDWNLGNNAITTFADWGDYSPSFVRHPQSQTVFKNQTARLVAEARGVGTVAYQWYFNGGLLPGATGNTLELANIQPAQAGDYHAVAQNSIGSVTSRTATVVVDTSDPGAGFEADLMPRNAGDGNLTVSDWTMVGRMAIGLDDPANASEFARTDCAPRSILGNGVIGIADWVQAGRYVAGLDPKTAAGGPNGVSPLAVAAPLGAPSAAREIALAALPSVGDVCRVAVRVRALGNENSIGFSVGFDAGALQFESVVVGGNAAKALLMSNATGASEGRVGVALALPAGGRLPTGEAEVAVLEFKRLAAGAAELTLADAPVAVEAASALAEPLVLVASASGYTIRDVGAGVLSVDSGAAGGVVQLEFKGQPGAHVVLEVSTNLEAWTPAADAVEVGADGTAQFTREAGGSHRFFRIRQVD